MNIDIVYGSFALCGLFVFWRCTPALAVLIVFLGGWILLPVGHYPVGASEAEFPYWITGLAVPSEMLLTKAWVAPASALLGVALFDPRALLRLRPVWLDAPMLMWCAWPLLQAMFVVDARPAGAVASLYLVGCWGLPWWLGRLYFSTTDAQLLLIEALGWSALACLPIALIEGAVGPVLYDLVYEIHPFRHDGAMRYLGYRPLGFFEDGNQYGLWIALCALAAWWLAVSSVDAVRAPIHRAVAMIVTAMALAAQSLGAILMLGMGAGFLWLARFVRPRRVIAGLLALMLACTALYLSGAVPITRIAKETALGQRVVAGFKAVGRDSFTWRISQDQRLMKDATARPVVGNGRWDWWRAQAMRPWGLVMMLLGQFGLIGLALGFGSLGWPAARAAWPARQASGWLPQGLPLMLATVIAMTLLDALLNSFIFFPALLIAGGLAGTRPQAST